MNSPEETLARWRDELQTDLDLVRRCHNCRHVRPKRPKRVNGGWLFVPPHAHCSLLDIDIKHVERSCCPGFQSDWKLRRIAAIDRDERALY